MRKQTCLHSVWPQSQKWGIYAIGCTSLENMWGIGKEKSRPSLAKTRTLTA